MHLQLWISFLYCFYHISWILVCCVFICLKVSSNFPCDFFFVPWIFNSGLFNFNIFVHFPVFFLLLISSFIPLWLQKELYMISIFSNLLTCFVAYHIIYPKETFQVHLRRICVLLLGGVFCMSSTSNWFAELFNTSISSLFFSLVVLPIIESRIMKSSAIIIELFLISLLSIVPSYIWGLCY